MNLYKFYSNQKELLHHDITNEIIPKLFFEKYENNLEELKKREKYIAKNTYYSYQYVCYTLKGSFSLGEEAISKYVYYSYYYAEFILKGPFSYGEEAISKDAKYTKNYLKLLSDEEKEEFKRKYL